MNAKDIVHNFAVVVIIIQAALFLLGWLYTVVVVGFIVFNGLLQMGGGRLIFPCYSGHQVKLSGVS